MNCKERAQLGLPLEECLVIDCHCHMGPWAAMHVPEGSPEGMLRSMNTLGIDIACPTAHAAIGPDYVLGNDLVMDAVRRYPERMIGYVTVNPNYPDEMEPELIRCFSQKGMAGIKCHPSLHGLSLEHPNYHPAYAYAEKRSCPVLFHVWGLSEVQKVERLARTYPHAKMILGHAGAEPAAMEYALELACRLDNVWLDLAISRTLEGNVEWFVEKAGSKKILYGSDMPFFDPRPAIGRVAMARISEEEKRDILGRNAAHLFGVDRAGIR